MTENAPLDTLTNLSVVKAITALRTHSPKGG